MLIESLGLDAICEELVGGKSIAQIGRDLGVSSQALLVWMRATPERLARIAEAKEDASMAYDDLALRALEDMPIEEIARAREVAQHYRWRAKVHNPNRYGDKSSLTVTAKVEQIDVQAIEAELRVLHAKGIRPSLPMVEDVTPKAVIGHVK